MPPLLTWSSINDSMTLHDSASRELNGSSSSHRGQLNISNWAKLARCFCPAERIATRQSFKLFRFIVSRLASTVLFNAFLEIDLRKERFSKVVNSSAKPKLWLT